VAFVQQAIRERGVIASTITDSEERKRALKWAFDSENKQRVMALRTLAETSRRSGASRRRGIRTRWSSPFSMA